MDIQNNNRTNFGMAFISPKGQDMKEFKKYLTRDGIIDTKSLGRFVLNQSNNEIMNLTFKNINGKNYFEIINSLKPKEKVLVDANDTFVKSFEKKESSFLEKFSKFFTNHTENKSVGLPDSMKKAGKMATEMENKYKQNNV